MKYIKKIVIFFDIPISKKLPQLKALFLKCGKKIFTIHYKYFSHMSNFIKKETSLTYRRFNLKILLISGGMFTFILPCFVVTGYNIVYYLKASQVLNRLKCMHLP